MKSNCVNCTSLEEIYLDSNIYENTHLKIKAHRCLDCGLIFHKVEED